MALDTALARRLMKQHGWTQKELAGMAGVTEAAMSRYLSGDRQPRADVVANMATALHTTSEALLGRTGEMSELDKAIRLVARNAGAITDSVKRRLIYILATPDADDTEEL
jgi:transcriptional regulator with XRE-family HTH domain